VLAQAHCQHRPVTAVVLDLDAFKQLNDHFGHEEGDRVLCETAQRLRAAFRAGDVLARAGGDEFFALLIDTSGEAAITAVDRLSDGPPHRGALSAGIAVWDPGEPLNALLRRADIALYEAKRAGGGHAVIAGPPQPELMPPAMAGPPR
jgi:diguanylate cyclase (GGDEF)-like protein